MAAAVALHAFLLIPPDVINGGGGISNATATIQVEGQKGSHTTPGPRTGALESSTTTASVIVTTTSGDTTATTGDLTMAIYGVIGFVIVVTSISILIEVTIILGRVCNVGLINKQIKFFLIFVSLVRYSYRQKTTMGYNFNETI